MCTHECFKKVQTVFSLWSNAIVKLFEKHTCENKYQIELIVDCGITYTNLVLEHYFMSTIKGKNFYLHG